MYVKGFFLKIFEVEEGMDTKMKGYQKRDNKMKMLKGSRSLKNIKTNKKKLSKYKNQKKTS